MTELRALTGARGIAAWFVVLYHIRLSIAGLPATYVAVFAKGYLAVDFFFLLSGFVIWLSWGERLREQRWRAVPTFFTKRVARIWPLHATMLAFAALVALALAVTGRADPVDFPPAELPLHLLLVQNWGLTDALSWNDPAWSISCELVAYLLFPLLALAIDWRRVPTPLVMAAIIALLGSLFLILEAVGAPRLGWDITHLGVIRCCLEFAAGTAIGALWLRWRDGPIWPALLAGTIGAALFVTWGLGAPETLVVPAAFAAILLALALTSRLPRNPLSAAPIHLLGEISYATYLGHFLLFIVFKLALVDDARAIPPLLMALYLAMVFAASVALYHLVERPAQRAMEAAIAQLRSRRLRISEA